MIPTRRIERKPNPWTPVPYMLRAVDHLVSHYRAGLPLLPGGRKTSITLAAFKTLKDAGKARTMLVIAPKRVARQVWRQEGKKWDDFNDLTFALVVGEASVRRKALESGADIYLINYENIPWLAQQYAGRPLPFDVIVFDELTKMQNAMAERHKALRPRLPGGGWRWGLTGSLFAKGHMAIFGQQLILDDGAALGRFITHYRDTFFVVGYNGFDYDLMPGAEKRIVAKLAPYWFYMDPADYAQLPPLVDIPHIGELEPQQRNLYERMKKDALIAIGVHTVTAANAGAVYSKLAQLANGAVYMDKHSNTDDVVKVHELKLDMLEELLDELNGEPLLVAYEFQHDIARIQERFGARFGGKVPYLGAGTTNKQEDQWVAEWNQRKLPLLLAHPQSASHGLNMQEGQAYNVAWFSITWDWELYDQFIRRVRRSGNEQARILNHLLIIKGTIDEEKLQSVVTKDFTERRLMTALNTQILREARGGFNTEIDTMVTKLSRPSEAAPQNNQQPAQQERQAPAGWGGGQNTQQQAPAHAPAPASVAPAGWGGTVQGDQSGDQRARIQEQIAPSRAAEAASAFSGGVGDSAARIAAEFATDAPQTDKAPAGWGGGQAANAATQSQAPQPDAPAPKRTRTKAASAEVDQSVSASLVESTLIAARARVVAAVLASMDPESAVEDIVDVSRELMAFVTEG